MNNCVCTVCRSDTQQQDFLADQMLDDVETASDQQELEFIQQVIDPMIIAVEKRIDDVAEPMVRRSRTMHHETRDTVKNCWLSPLQCLLYKRVAHRNLNKGGKTL
jgi:hypothetical protein